MPSTFSPNLRIELIATGEQSNTWGITTNNNLGTLLEQSISGLVEIDVTAGDVTLTALNGESDQSRNMMLKITGTPGTSRTITVPEVTKLYVVNNTSDDEVTVVSSATGSTGITLKSLSSNVLACDGTDVIRAIYGASDPGTPIYEQVISAGSGGNALATDNYYTQASFSYTPKSTDSTIKLEISFPYNYNSSLGSSFISQNMIVWFRETTSGTPVLLQGYGVDLYPNYVASSNTYFAFLSGQCFQVLTLSNAALTTRTFDVAVRRNGSSSTGIFTNYGTKVAVTEIQN